MTFILYWLLGMLAVSILILAYSYKKQNEIPWLLEAELIQEAEDWLAQYFPLLMEKSSTHYSRVSRKGGLYYVTLKIVPSTFGESMCFHVVTVSLLDGGDRYTGNLVSGDIEHFAL